MDNMWAYSERSNMRKRAARRVNKMFESLEKEISCQPEKRPTLNAIDMSFETDVHESEDEVASQYSEGVQRATRNLEQPQESWAAYKVRILYTANNYSEARRKLPLAEQQTDLQSEAETDPLRAPKRKVKRNRRLLDDYDTDEEAIAPKKCLPQAPYIQPLLKRACSALDEVQPSPLQHRPQRSPSVTQVPGTSRQALMERSSTSQWQNFESALGKSLRQAIDLPAQSPAQTLFQTAHQMGPEAENYRGSTLQSPEEPTQPLWHRETPRRSYSTDDPFKKSLLHDVLTKLEVVMEQQRHILRMIQDLKSNNVREITEENEISPSLFPVEDLRSLTSLESNLRSSPETRRKVVIELGLLGGVDAKDTIWRVMKQTIKNDFAKTMNWKGANGKTPFQGLELKNVVIEAVRRNPACSQTTELEVEKVIRRWFYLAGDREGGRKKRTPLQRF